jgi:uncharacterized protein with ParB-like and HNH nuclease domain
LVSGPEEIHLLVEKAVDGSLDIPEFQRGFVWRPDQVKALADSLFRDYPVGEILLWKNKDYVSPRSTENGLIDVSWIVDGQQRTSALCLLFKRKPYWTDLKKWDESVKKNDVYFRVIPDKATGYAFSLKSPSIEKNPEWISVSKVLNTDKGALAELASSILTSLGKSVADAAQFTIIFSSLQLLNSVRNKTVFEQEIQHKPEDVAEIFGRLNSAGTKVKEADIFVALVAAKNRDWVREKFLPFVTGLEEDGYDLEPGIFIRTLTAIAVRKVDLKEIGQDFWEKDLDLNWNKTEKTMTTIIQNLTAKGILNSDLLPTKNALIPLFVLHDKFGSGLNFNHAFYWFLLASRDGRYSTSSNTILTSDIQIIGQSKNATAAVTLLLKTLETDDNLKAEDFMNAYNKDKFLALLTYLLIFSNKAMDWLDDGHRIGFDKSESVLNNGYKPEWNHFFPKGKRVLRAAGNDYSDQEINALANITLLTEKSNRMLSDNPPEFYIKKLGINQSLLNQQMIPSGIQLSVSNYRLFLAGRSKKLAKAAESYLAAIRP